MKRINDDVGRRADARCLLSAAAGPASINFVKVVSDEWPINCNSGGPRVHVRRRRGRYNFFLISITAKVITTSDFAAAIFDFSVLVDPVTR